MDLHKHGYILVFLNWNLFNTKSVGPISVYVTRILSGAFNAGFNVQNQYTGTLNHFVLSGKKITEGIATTHRLLSKSD